MGGNEERRAKVERSRSGEERAAGGMPRASLPVARAHSPGPFAAPRRWLAGHMALTLGGMLASQAPHRGAGARALSAGPPSPPTCPPPFLSLTVLSLRTNWMPWPGYIVVEQNQHFSKRMAWAWVREKAARGPPERCESGRREAPAVGRCSLLTLLSFAGARPGVLAPHRPILAHTPRPRAHIVPTQPKYKRAACAFWRATRPRIGAVARSLPQPST